MEAKYVVRLTFNQAAELHDAYEQMRIRMCKRKKRKNKTEKKWKKKKKMTESVVPWRYSPRFSGRRSLSA